MEEQKGSEHQQLNANSIEGETMLTSSILPPPNSASISSTKFKKFTKKPYTKPDLSDSRDPTINDFSLLNSSLPFIMKVKRKRDDEDLNEIYLEYDK
jgi:hypothetical protein